MENSRDRTTRLRFPLVHKLVVAFHLDARKHTEHVETPRASRIRRATTNAVLALELASRGHRSTVNLRLAHEAISVCSCLFELLFLEERLESRLQDDLQRQMEVILRSLDDLARAPVEKWPEIEIASIP